MFYALSAVVICCGRASLWIHFRERKEHKEGAGSFFEFSALFEVVFLVLSLARLPLTSRRAIGDDCRRLGRASRNLIVT